MPKNNQTAPIQVQAKEALGSDAGDGDGKKKKRGGSSGYGGDDEDPGKYGPPVKFDPDFNGPTKRRSCTDVICLLGFIAFCCFWVGVAIFGVAKGDISRVLYATDSRGRVCGKGDLTHRPKLLFFDLTRCLNPAVVIRGCPTPQVCVEECPQEKFSGYALAMQGRESEAKAKMRPFCHPMSDEQWSRKTARKLISDGQCPAWVLPSRAILGRCLPIGTLSKKDGENEAPNKDVVSKDMSPDHAPVTASTLTKAITALGAFLSVRDFGERICNDLADTWWMIGLAYIGATVVSFIWIVAMRFVAAIMVWLSMGLLAILVGGTLGYSVYRYKWIVDNVESKKSEMTILDVNFTPDYLNDVLALKDTWLAFIIILSILFFIIMLIIIALRKRIQIAINLIEQGSKAVGQLLSTLAFPVIPFILQIFVILWFLAVAMYLASIGEATYKIGYEKNVTDLQCGPFQCINKNTNNTFMPGDVCDQKTFNSSGCDVCFDGKMECQFMSYRKLPVAGWMHAFNLFGLYWGMCFVSSFSELVLAGAFATWYWTWDKSQVPFFTLGRSLSNTVIFHLGTVAFGSLIIAIIKFIRAIVSYVESKLKMYNNDLVRCLFCLCKCCLWCLEKFMRFINRNAYIMCAIKSTNFCISAKDAFNLLMRNILRVLVLNKIVDFLMLLGKLVIMAGVGAMSYFVFSGAFPELKDNIPTLNYFVTPVVAIVIGTYFIASSFFSVYVMAVDTLFLCFLEDMERNDGTPSRPYYMSKGLQKIVGKMQQFNEDKMKYEQMMEERNK